MDIRTTNNPHDVARYLRNVARQYQDDAEALSAAWQDQTAGFVWVALANELMRCADKCDKAVDKHFV